MKNRTGWFRVWLVGVGDEYRMDWTLVGARRWQGNGLGPGLGVGIPTNKKGPAAYRHRPILLFVFALVFRQ